MKTKAKYVIVILFLMYDTTIFLQNDRLER